MLEGPPTDPHRAAATERGMLALLVVGVAVAWGVQWQPFLLPNNDYYSFQRLAESFAAGEMPSSFKRMPIFPALMALVAPLAPGPHPYLQAGLFLNALFSLATLGLLYRYATDTLGRAGVLLPALFATSLQFHYNGLQSLVEPSLAFFVVAAFVLDRRRSSWKWAAAFAAALSRYEAAVLIPVLCVADWAETRRFWAPALRAAAASSGVLVWTALGALQGSGGGWYLEFMESMGFQPALGFFARQLEEPFAGWYMPGLRGLPILAVAVGGPLAVGIVQGVRRFGRDGWVLLAFWGLCTCVVVAFGVDKARYVHHTQWIPLFFWIAGILYGIPWALRRLAALPPRLRGAARVATALAGVAAAILWVHRIATQPSLGSAWLELLLLVPALGLVAAWVYRELHAPSALAAAGEGSPGRAARATVAIAAVVALGVAVAGGVAGRQREIVDMYWDNASSHVLAPWLEANLEEGEKAVILPVSHVVFLSGLPRDVFVRFADFEAEGPLGLAEAMRAQGARYAIWTHRGRVRKPSHHYYYRAKRQDLAELFREGGPVPGFFHVATLPVPEEAEESDVQIYALGPPLPTD